MTDLKPVWPDFFAPPKHDNPDPRWVDPALPDFRLIWKVARECGYAVGLHGSMKRDCDLIAAPWTDEAVLAFDLIDHLCTALNAKVVGPVAGKPHGRLGWNLQVDGYVKVIDISVVPRNQDRAALPARGVGVKPLQWNDAAFLEQYAKSVAGTYRVFEKDGLWRATVHTVDDAHFIAETDYLHDAQVAAQADYEARILAALAPTDYTLAPHLQKIVDGAKTAPQWDMQADRLAPTDAPHVNETPKSEHDAGNVLTDAAQAREDVDIVEWLRAGPDDVSISFTLQGPNGMLSVQYEKPRVAAELVEEWRRSK